MSICRRILSRGVAQDLLLEEEEEAEDIVLILPLPHPVLVLDLDQVIPLPVPVPVPDPDQDPETPDHDLAQIHQREKDLLLLLETIQPQTINVRNLPLHLLVHLCHNQTNVLKSPWNHSHVFILI